jgi:hypothetical protein
MKRNHIFNRAVNPAHQEVNRKVAIHEAGHAAAIYLGNKQKRLPPVFFQIFITPVNDGLQSSRFLGNPDIKYIANIEGGRLIPILPSSIEAATSGFSSEQITAYQQAFEADMINILVGSLAEAKYISQRDGMLINPRLRNLNALYYFGGISDVECINEYLNCFFENSDFRRQKIAELLWTAFSFINEGSNWHAITALADHIVREDRTVMECNEIISVLENC